MLQNMISKILLFYYDLDNILIFLEKEGKV